jgi:hypothetical protein
MGAQMYRVFAEVGLPDYGAIAEVGAERGEGSTAWLADFAVRQGRDFVSIDPNAERIAEVKARFPSARAFQAKGEDFFGENSLCLAALYLDGMDFLWPHVEYPDYGQIEASYAAMGMRVSNLDSQISHLLIAQRTEPVLVRGAVVLVDDTCCMSDGTYQGKGGAAVPYYIACGFRDITKQYRKEFRSAVLLQR